MGFLDKAKKLAEQAAEKAGPLIDKAAPHAQNAVDKAGQQIDRRTGGKYRDKIEAVEAKVGELAEKRMAGRGGEAAGAAPAAGAADEFPARPEPVDASAGSAPTAGGGFPAAPAQPDLSGGQPDDPAYSGAPGGGFPTGSPATAGAEPAFSAGEPDITFPAPVPDTTYQAEPDSRAGQPDDPTHSLAPDGTADFPGLSEGKLGAPSTDEDRHSGPAGGGAGTP